MSSPSHEVQTKIVGILKDDATLTALIAKRVFDRVETPGAVTFPYVSWGPEQVVPQRAECIEGQAIFIQLDAWSQKPGFPQVKAIAEAVKQALHDADLELEENAQVSIEHQQTRFLRDPDGLTSHAVIEFVAFIEQPN